MIDVEALRMLYVDSKDVLPNVFEDALSKLNWKKEEILNIFS